VVLFGVQKFLWPVRFAEFMSSIRYTLPLEINYSPVAMFGRFLEFIGHPSDRAAVAFYIAVSLAIFGILVYFAREFRRKIVAGQNLAAVVLVSTALFALRLKEYDLLPLTIPMALIVLRGVRNPVARIALILGAVAVGVALITDRLMAVDTISVTTVFLVGVYGLSTEAQASRALRQREQVAIPQAIRV
jgi:multisubunit Na+/H+ antiporter MnhF subunit